MTLIELLVGLALGLLVIAATTLALGAQMRDAHRLLLEARLTQDLHAVHAQLQRGVRRAGYAGDAVPDTWTQAVAPGWLPSVDETNGQWHYAHADAQADAVVWRGLRLRHGVLQMRLHPQAGWQPLTDPQAMIVTELRIRPVRRAYDLGAICGGTCPHLQDACDAHLHAQVLDVQVLAHAAGDPALQRTVQTRLRLPNHALEVTCGA